jgi:cyclophilin family peptidyl-prolyl cis-trans isomerase/HEAT repeat protein
MKRLVLSILVVLGLFSCKETSPVNKFADATLIKIADLRDRRLSDSLYLFLASENSIYREEAVLAFASIQDSVALEKIAKLLKDEQKSVRKAAAFAIGQTPSKESGRILFEVLGSERDVEVVNEILEAYGKVTQKWEAHPVADNTIKERGVAWSLYRAGLNGTVDSSFNTSASTLLTKPHGTRTRLGAAHFFSRGAKSFTSFLPQLSTAALNDSAPEVQMAAALALRRIKTDSSFMAIEKIVSSKGDYRVRVNAMRALQAFPFIKTKNYLLKSVNDANANIGIAASEAILASVTADSWIEIANVAPEAKNWRIQANLYQAVLKVSENKSVIDEIKEIYKRTANPYQKAALLSALQQSFSSLEFIEQELANADTAILRSTAASALVELNKSKNFKPSFSKRFAETYQKAMASGDPAVIGTIASALGDSTLGYRSTLKDFSFLYKAKKKLSLPKDNEALQPLEAAIAHFEKRKLTSEVKNEFNHPIDWTLVKSIPADQLATIKTSKGTIVIRLLVEEAPGSVANFVSLAQQDYFDQKFFHRVVPNFVIQGGCKRGDGSGSEDYSIRSEFSQRRYTTGSVGMASAGKDTEGTQWFITHSPTPHLDGRYTIFAEVESGMEVVHRIEVGDQILDVEIKIPGTEKK